MDGIETRKRIQKAGNELYKRLGKTSKNLQYLAGEIMYGNEEHIRKAQTTNCLFTIGDETILKQGFTDNQIIFLTKLEAELKANEKDCTNCKYDGIMGCLNDSCENMDNWEPIE